MLLCLFSLSFPTSGLKMVTIKAPTELMPFNPSCVDEWFRHYSELISRKKIKYGYEVLNFDKVCFFDFCAPLFLSMPACLSFFLLVSILAMMSLQKFASLESEGRKQCSPDLPMVPDMCRFVHSSALIHR